MGQTQGKLSSDQETALNFALETACMQTTSKKPLLSLNAIIDQAQPSAQKSKRSESKMCEQREKPLEVKKRPIESDFLRSTYKRVI